MERVLHALDALELALANHAPYWTDDERQFYEDAVAISCDGYTETDSSVSGKCPPRKPSNRPHLPTARA